MTGAGAAGDGDRPGDDSGGNVFHGPAGVQRGSGNLQVNFHEHRAGVLSACAVALVCVATVVVVWVGGGPDGGPDTRGGTAGVTPGNTDPATAPGTTPPRSDGADPPALTGRLVNVGSGLCLRVPHTADDAVPVQDTCTAAADRTWTLTPRSASTHTLRNAHSGRCLAVTGRQNLSPARQLGCAGGPEGRHWELLWGTGDRAGRFMLRVIGAARCLVVQGPAADRPAAQVSCGEEYDDQWWRLSAPQARSGRIPGVERPG